MLTFHISLHARPIEATSGATLEIDSKKIATLTAPHESLATPLPVSFEQAMTALEQLPRMFIEPDGSFVWTSGNDEPRWQVDGNLFDRNGRLLFVDLKGRCPTERFDELLSACGWPAVPVMMQLVLAAVFVSESDFRRWADSTTF